MLERASKSQLGDELDVKRKLIEALDIDLTTVSEFLEKLTQKNQKLAQLILVRFPSETNIPDTCPRIAVAICTGHGGLHWARGAANNKQRLCAQDLMYNLMAAHDQAPAVSLNPVKAPQQFSPLMLICCTSQQASSFLQVDLLAPSCRRAVVVQSSALC